MHEETRGRLWRTELLPHSHEAWPDVRQRLSAELDALLAGREDVTEAWQRAVAAADIVSHGHAAAAAVKPPASQVEPPTLPSTWLNAPGGPRQCLAAVANVLRAAISIDTVAEPVDLGAARTEASLGSACHIDADDADTLPFVQSNELEPPPASCLLLASGWARSLVACRLLGLAPTPSELSSADGLRNMAEVSDSHGGKETESKDEAKGETRLAVGHSSHSSDVFGSMALLHAFTRPHAVAADDLNGAPVVVTKHTERRGSSVEKLTNLNAWCHNASPLCSVLVVSSGSDSALIADAGTEEEVAAPSGTVHDTYIKLAAASILLPPEADLSSADRSSDVVVEIRRTAAVPPVSRSSPDRDVHGTTIDDGVALRYDDLRWLTDYEQHECAGSDCYADCHVVWQLMMAFTHVTAGLDAKKSSQDFCDRASCKDECHTARDKDPEEGLYSVAEASAGAALTAEDAVQLHCTARLRSPALVAPAIVVYESACDADYLDSNNDETAAAPCVSQQQQQQQQQLPAFAAVGGSRRGDLAVSAFADALATSLLGDALASRPPPAVRSDSERRPSMPTIVEEALGGSGCCFSASTVGSSMCCVDGSSRDADSSCDRGFNATVADSPAEVMPLCEFAEKLAADVLREAMHSARCGDALPASPDELSAVDDSGPMQLPLLMARSGSVGSEATACSWQSLDDFSQGILASAISEAKQEWFGRLAALAGDAFDNDGSYDASDSVCSYDGDLNSSFSGDMRRGDGCVGKGRRSTSEHARFFRWEFVDRSSNGRLSNAGRRGSEPARWATAAAAAATAMERRGSAPCTLPSKRARIGDRTIGDRRPSDYFDDEFLRRLRGRSGATGDRLRRGSAPTLSGRHSAVTVADQSNDDYFQAEFVAAQRPSSAAFSQADCSGNASTTAACDHTDGTPLLAGSVDCVMPTGYLSLYSDVLVENVMRASFRELAKRARVAAASSHAANTSELVDEFSNGLAPLDALAVQQQPPNPTGDAFADQTAVDRFAFCLAEQLVSDALGCLTGASSSSADGVDNRDSGRRSCLTAAAGSSCQLATLSPKGVDCSSDWAVHDEGILPPDAEALALRRRSSGRRESRATYCGHQPQHPDDSCLDDARSSGPSPRPYVRNRLAATLDASWEFSGASSDEPHEQLAALLSWVAASVAGVDELCIRVSQGLLAEKLEAVVRQALAMQLTAGDMTKLALDYCRTQQEVLDRQAARSYRSCGSPSILPFAFVSERM